MSEHSQKNSSQPRSYILLAHTTQDNEKKKAEILGALRLAKLNEITMIVLYNGTHYQGLIIDKVTNPDKIRLFYLDPSLSKGNTSVIKDYLDDSKFKDNYNLYYNENMSLQEDNGTECGPMVIRYLNKAFLKTKFGEAK